MQVGAVEQATLAADARIAFSWDCDCSQTLRGGFWYVRPVAWTTMCKCSIGWMKMCGLTFDISWTYDWSLLDMCMKMEMCTSVSAFSCLAIFVLAYRIEFIWTSRKCAGASLSCCSSQRSICCVSTRVLVLKIIISHLLLLNKQERMTRAAVQNHPTYVTKY